MTEFAIIFFLKYSSAQVGEHEKHGWTISRLEDHPNSSTNIIFKRITIHFKNAISPISATIIPYRCSKIAVCVSKLPFTGL